MPPKKTPTGLASQKSLLPLAANGATPASSRVPVAAPPLPASDAVEPLWTPTSHPRELFPEWPSAAALAAENWGSAESPFDDPLPLSELFLPLHDGAGEIVWKRPSQFLPLIVDRAPATPLAPVAHEPKAPPVKKGAAPAAKKAAPEPEPAKKAPPPKHAHVFYVDPHHDATVPSLQAAVTTAAGSYPHPSATTATGAQSALPTSSADPAHRSHRIPRDFRRLWSAAELEELAKWRLEEARIERETQQRERVYMGFEDAIAYIVNERPRGFAAEQDVDADDLVDDGQDDDDDGDEPDGAGGSPADALSNDSSPWGVVPPPRIGVAPNAVCKPEVPHGDVVHGAMAALVRTVEQLFAGWSGSGSADDAGASFLWRAIHPQDALGTPVYNAGGKYAVKLFVLGRWRRVDVDDRLPVDADDNVVCLASSMRSEIWPSLLAKALLKVLHWLFGGAVDTAEASGETRALRFVNAVFVPGEHLHDESFDSATDAYDEQQDGADSVASDVAGLSPQSAPMTPRALVCCTSARGAAALCPGEAALVMAVVGDTDSATLKFASLKGATSVPEEQIATDHLAFLLVHPPFRSSDVLVQQWTATPSESAAGEAPSLRRWTPFANPGTQFVLVAMPQQPAAQSAVEVVFTLTRIPPSDASAELQDARLRAAAETAAFVPGMDPHGSVVLVNEPTRRTRSRPTAARELVIPPLSPTMSTRVLLPRRSDDERAVVVLRVHPQQSLCYGYGLQVEANVKVDFQDPSTCWRNVDNLQVVHSDGAYSVVPPDAWTVLVKHAVELTPPPHADSSAVGTHPSALDLYVDLRVADAALVPFVHVAVVNDVTGAVTPLGSLCAAVSLPVGDDPAAPHAFTVLVDCAPRGRHAPAGTWHLTLGSSWQFTASAAHPMKLTAFEGRYAANKPLLLFRDVLVAPVQALYTSFELQLLGDDNDDNDNDDELADALVVKLEVIDAASEQLVSEASATRAVRLLQLPRRPHWAADARYILQGSLDRARCVVPAALSSARPFRDSVGSVAPTEESVVEHDSGDAEPPAPIVVSARAPSSVRWRLNCWSGDDVRLDVDRAKENRFEAIRAAWADAARERPAATHAAVSRLLFLGCLDAADARIRHDGVSDELAARVKARFEWVAAATAAGARVGGGAYLERRVRDSVAADAPERLKTLDECRDDERGLREAIDTAHTCRATTRNARANAREQRAREVNELVQSVREQRAAAVRARAKLWQQRDASARRHTESAA
ncbi:hypothetical protein PybrP1_004726 [[Pythium] brassicae (nom. inval.)]|nr:hypothetical protein PybrP1_004726 [[Pythium] brassicae (nom. inval.)]